MSDLLSEISLKVWEDLVIGRFNPRFSTLPVKIHLSYCRRMVRQDRSLRSVRKSALAMNEFFLKTAALPHIRRDFNKILVRS